MGIDIYLESKARPRRTDFGEGEKASKKYLDAWSNHFSRGRYLRESYGGRPCAVDVLFPETWEGTDGWEPSKLNGKETRLEHWPEGVEAIRYKINHEDWMVDPRDEKMYQEQLEAGRHATIGFYYPAQVLKQRLPKAKRKVGYDAVYGESYKKDLEAFVDMAVKLENLGQPFYIVNSY